MNKLPEISICHLYPDLLSYPGDLGNLIVLQKRAVFYGLKSRLVRVDQPDQLAAADCQIIYLGGSLKLDLAEQTGLLGEIEAGSLDRLFKGGRQQGLILASGASWGLLGNYHQQLDGRRLTGPGLLDLHTVQLAQAINSPLSADCKIEPDLLKDSRLLGFSNQRQQIFLGSQLEPLAQVLEGYGNNGSDQTEGVLTDNLLGSTAAGALLPRNPALADYLLVQTLARQGYQLELPTYPDDDLAQKIRDSWA